MHKMVYSVVHKVLEAPTPCNASSVRAGAIWPGSVHSGSTIKQGRRDPRECAQIPLQQSAVNTKHSLCDPKPKLTQEKAVKQKGWKGITPIPFLNPDPVAQLVGCANKASVVIDG